MFFVKWQPLLLINSLFHLIFHLQSSLGLNIIGRKKSHKIFSRLKTLMISKTVRIATNQKRKMGSKQVMELLMEIKTMHRNNP